MTTPILFCLEEMTSMKESVGHPLQSVSSDTLSGQGRCGLDIKVFGPEESILNVVSSFTHCQPLKVNLSSLYYVQ